MKFVFLLSSINMERFSFIVYFSFIICCLLLLCTISYLRIVFEIQIVCFPDKYKKTYIMLKYCCIQVGSYNFPR